MTLLDILKKHASNDKLGYYKLITELDDNDLTYIRADGWSLDMFDTYSVGEVMKLDTRDYPAEYMVSDQWQRITEKQAKKLMELQNERRIKHFFEK